MDNTLRLIANPGSASRKYALYDSDKLRGSLHFEWQNNQLVYSLNSEASVPAEITSLDDAPSKIIDIFRYHNLFDAKEKLGAIGLRIVAPGSYFLENHLVDQDFITKLSEARSQAPLHTAASLGELKSLQQQFGEVPIIGASDSAFHVSRPDFAQYYSIPKNDADRLDIKRFGYHGLSVASIVRKLGTIQKLPPKLVVAHLGSGASITAILNARAVDNTMGYSPLEGLTMSTRSGNIDPSAITVLRQSLGLEDADLEDYLNSKSGLLGLGGSSEIPELLEKEAAGDDRARLALNTYVYNIQKGIAQMAAAMGGIDALALTGTVGERSAPIRHHITGRLCYLDFFLDEPANLSYSENDSVGIISRLAHSKPIFVIHTDEAFEILEAIKTVLKS